ncbi:MAG: N-acetylmuramoyl-L-alanine amidase [Gordonia sp. (in: high G+C Gram-positive bacteria)]
MKSVSRRRATAIAGTAAAGSLVATLLTGIAVDGAAGHAGADPVRSLAGKTVFLDPGHQGSADGHSLTKQVPDGRGGTKDCQTTGATAVTGKAEHEINWNVAQLVKAGLESQGARVILSRADDTGWGGCVDERAAAASAAKADVAVSLHADSTSTGTDTSKSGFHVIVPELPLANKAADTAQRGGGLTASKDMRDAFKAAGFTPANYAGVVDGIQTRSDVAAVNLTTVPAVFVEMGNLSNPVEAAALSSAQGDTKYALAVTDGIKRFLAAGPGSPAATAPAPEPAAPGATPPATTDPSGDDGVDLDGLAAVAPLIEQLTKAKSLNEAQQILAAQGSDVSADVLKAMLSVVYSVFGGKLPI